MAMEKLTEMNPPSGRVSVQGLLAAPILKRRQRRNREEIAKKGSVLEGFGLRCKYRPKGGHGGGPGSARARRGDRTLGRPPRAPGPVVSPLRSSFCDSGRFLR